MCLLACSHCTRRRLLYGRCVWQLKLITRVGKGYAARLFVRGLRRRITAATVLQRLFRSRAERQMSRARKVLMMFGIGVALQLQLIGRAWLARRRVEELRAHARMRAECAAQGVKCVKGAQARVVDALCIDQYIGKGYAALVAQRPAPVLEIQDAIPAALLRTDEESSEALARRRAALASRGTTATGTTGDAAADDAEGATPPPDGDGNDASESESDDDDAADAGDTTAVRRVVKEMPPPRGLQFRRRRPFRHDRQWAFADYSFFVGPAGGVATGALWAAFFEKGCAFSDAGRARGAAAGGRPVTPGSTVDYNGWMQITRAVSTPRSSRQLASDVQPACSHN